MKPLLTISLLLFLAFFSRGNEIHYDNNLPDSAEYRCGDHYVYYYSKENGFFHLFERFSLFCGTWARVDGYQFDNEISDVLFKINEELSAVHISNGAWEIFVQDSNKTSIEIIPTKTYTITNDRNGKISYLYILKNSDLKGYDMVHISEYMLDENGEIKENWYEGLCLRKAGIIYNYFQKFANLGILKGIKIVNKY